MAVVVDADRVEVQVVDVPVRRDGELERLVKGDVVEAVPLEQDPTGWDVDLLDDALDQAGVDGTADAGEVGRTSL